MSLLEVCNLHTEITTPRGMVKAINGIDFQLESGEILALVGESGSGKSMTAMSIMGLLPKKTARITEGSIRLNERDITKFSEKEYNLIRGQEMAMIFQNPLTALDPTYKIGQQLSKTIAFRKNINLKEAKKEASYWLEKVGISDVDRVMNAYPHALSGGMRQRAVIAMTISCQPKILIADEPTTALDATIQKQILTLLKKINQELNISVIIITHDFGVVANLSDKVAVMYAGKIIEYGETRSIFSSPRHPYTQGLIKAVPEIGMKKLHHRLVQIDGSPPDLLTLPKSCSFAPRCREATSRCFAQAPNKVAFGNEHFAVCFNREAERRDHTG